MLNQEYWSRGAHNHNQTHSHNQNYKMQIPRVMHPSRNSSKTNNQSGSGSSQRNEFNPAAVAAVPVLPVHHPPPTKTLINPKPIPNPVQESRERKELHRELLWNQRIGNNVLNNKTELQKVLQERRFHSKDPNNLSTSTPGSGSTVPEFLKVHQRITHGNQSTDH